MLATDESVGPRYLTARSANEQRPRPPRKPRAVMNSEIEVLAMRSCATGRRRQKRWIVTVGEVVSCMAAVKYSESILCVNTNDDYMAIMIEPMPAKQREVCDQALKSMAHAARERLAFIELQAFFCGSLRRSDIESRFGVAEAAATRDIQTYRDLAPNNLHYDGSAKVYVPLSPFSPVFDFDRQRVLSWLSQGFAQGLTAGRAGKPVPSVRVIEMGLPDLQVLAAVTRAIHGKAAVRLNYLSFSSGETNRELVPHAIVDNGIRWHVRAYDRDKKRFSDFVIARMAKPVEVAGEILEEEGFLFDHQWNRMVDLELVPHPGLRHPQVVVREFGITDGVLRRQCRAAIVGYLLRLWGVDCTADHESSPEIHHLWLQNGATLYGVESAALAPDATTFARNLSEIRCGNTAAE